MLGELGEPHHFPRQACGGERVTGGLVGVVLPELYTELPSAARQDPRSEGRQSALDSAERGEESQDPDDHA